MKKNFNSTENQKIKGDFVNREIYANVGSMVEYILRKSFEDNDTPFSYEDVDMERYSFEGDFVKFEDFTREQRDEVVNELDQIVSQIEESEDGIVEIIDEDGFLYVPSGIYTKEQAEDISAESYDVEYLDGEPVEVYEWWVVSRWLANKLEEKGEVILDGDIWGRQTTGQAILLDGVISEICDELELLK